VSTSLSSVSASLSGTQLIASVPKPEVSCSVGVDDRRALGQMELVQVGVGKKYEYFAKDARGVMYKLDAKSLNAAKKEIRDTLAGRGYKFAFGLSEGGASGVLGDIGSEMQRAVQKLTGKAVATTTAYASPASLKSYADRALQKLINTGYPQFKGKVSGIEQLAYFQGAQPLWDALAPQVTAASSGRVLRAEELLSASGRAHSHNASPGYRSYSVGLFGGQVTVTPQPPDAMGRLGWQVSWSGAEGSTVFSVALTGQFGAAQLADGSFAKNRIGAHVFAARAADTPANVTPSSFNARGMNPACAKLAHTRYSAMREAGYSIELAWSNTWQTHNNGYASSGAAGAAAALRLAPFKPPSATQRQGVEQPRIASYEGGHLWIEPNRAGQSSKAYWFPPGVAASAANLVRARVVYEAAPGQVISEATFDPRARTATGWNNLNTAVADWRRSQGQLSNMPAIEYGPANMTPVQRQVAQQEAYNSEWAKYMQQVIESGSVPIPMLDPDVNKAATRTWSDEFWGPVRRLLGTDNPLTNSVTGRMRSNLATLNVDIAQQGGQLLKMDANGVIALPNSDAGGRALAFLFYAEAGLSGSQSSTYGPPDLQKLRAKLALSKGFLSGYQDASRSIANGQAMNALQMLSGMFAARPGAAPALKGGAGQRPNVDTVAGARTQLVPNARPIEVKPLRGPAPVRDKTTAASKALPGNFEYSKAPLKLSPPPTKIAPELLGYPTIAIKATAVLEVKPVTTKRAVSTEMRSAVSTPTTEPIVRQAVWLQPAGQLQLHAASGIEQPVLLGAGRPALPSGLTSSNTPNTRPTAATSASITSNPSPASTTSGVASPSLEQQAAKQANNSTPFVSIQTAASTATLLIRPSNSFKPRTARTDLGRSF
jgi:hypothetical protein